MKQKFLGALISGLAASALLCGAAVADPGGGQHGPPPGKGPKRTPEASQTPSPGDSGNTNHGNPGNKGSGNKGKGSCMSTCQQTRRGCVKDATAKRKDCYKNDCADERAAVKACRGAGDGVTDTGGGDGVTDTGSGDGVTDNGSGDGVTDNGGGDQGGGCSAKAHLLTDCLKACRNTLTTARQDCSQAVLGCADTCRTPGSAPVAEATAAPTPTATSIPVP
jgi:hypothetical protein